MNTRKRGGSRQADLFPRSKRPTIPIDENHRLVQLTDRLDRNWKSGRNRFGPAN